MEKVIVIVGPTATGKSKLGVELAKRLNGEIISGDSMQVYKGLSIATAKISQEEMGGIPHHLIDFLEIEKSYSIASFQEDARRIIHEITTRGHVPFIVGGSGLYHKAALYDYDFYQTPHEETVDLHSYDALSNEELYAELEKIDFEAAKTLHPNNRRRVLRAIQIYLESGQTKSTHIEQQQHRPLYDVLFIGLNMDRSLLYKRIENRVDEQMKNGLLEEAKMLYTQYEGKTTAMQSIGYKEFIPYFQGQCRLEDVVYNIKKATKRYAKRQLTWFHHQVEVKWFVPNYDDFHQTVDEVEQYVKEKM